MAELNNKFEIFGDDGDSNREEKLEQRSKDWGETKKESKKVVEKD